MTSRNDVQYARVPSQPEITLSTNSSRVNSSRRRRKKKRHFSKHKNDNICIWFFRSPFTKWGFLFFLASAIGSLAILGAYFYIQKKLPYVVIGILGNAVAIYGLYHFKQILSLRKEIENKSQLNLKLKKGLILFDTEVNSLEAINANVKQQQKQIFSSVSENKEISEGFKTLTKHMHTFNIESIGYILGVCQKVNKGKGKWIDELISEERYVMHALFDRFEKRGNSKKGMTIQGFDAFVQSIPNIYRGRFKRVGTFNEITNFKNIITYRDFGFALDSFCDAQAKELSDGSNRILSDNNNNGGVDEEDDDMHNDAAISRTMREMQEIQARREELIHFRD